MSGADKLLAIVAEIGCRLEAEESPRAIADDLAARHGGRRWEEYGTVKLRLAGITVSCTAGEPMILWHWVGRAKRVAEEAGER